MKQIHSSVTELYNISHSTMTEYSDNCTIMPTIVGPVTTVTLLVLRLRRTITFGLGETMEEISKRRKLIPHFKEKTLKKLLFL